ncbi:MAG: hypothetical protein LKE89_02590 [Lactobacillaceae bacterium]|nr:hypothetical protein [Lactobacillaceae bacterium]
MQIVGQKDALTVGLAILPGTGTMVVVAPFAGKAVDWFGEKISATVGLICQGAGYLILTLFVGSQSGYVGLILPLVLAGVVGTTVSVIVFNRFGSIGSPVSFANGFQETMFVATIFSLMGVIFSLRFKRISPIN